MSGLGARISLSVRLNVTKAAQLLAAAIVLFLISLPLCSQVNTGRISGAITDQTSGAIGGAMVTVTDVSRGESRPLVADSAGLYAAPNLTPGTYTVRAEFKGFQTVERQNIVVGVGGDVRVDITLRPGQQTQTVTVTESVPIVNTTNAQTGGTLENNLISNLPLNGRNFRWLIGYVPGVVLLPGEGNGSSSTYGGGPDNMNFMVDGLYAMGLFQKVPSVGGAGEAGDTTLLPLDAIQEVAVVSNPKAEYGWDPGLTVSVGLKSGTNALHGSAYAFGRDQDLDARNAFAATTTPLAFEQWGATLGGRIKKDKLFYLLGYESTRLSITSTATETSPTTAHFSAPAANCQGSVVGNCASSIPDAIAAMNASGHAVNPLSLNLAGCDYTSANINSVNPTTVASACAHNALGFASLFNNFSATTTSVTNNFPDTGGNDNGLAKFDYHLNDNHTLSGSYYFGQYYEYDAATAAVTEPYWEELLNVRNQSVRGVEIWTPNSSWLNEARVGWDHDSRPISTGECTGNSLGIGATPGALGAPIYSTDYQMELNAPACGMPTITISGFTDQLGQANNRAVFESDMQGADTLSYTRGTHQFKFGVDIRDVYFSGSQPGDTQKGEIGFGATGVAAFSGATPLESFLAGAPSSESIRLGNPERAVGWYQIGAFVQDDWRITPRLTLNAGLRWELQTSARDANGLLGAFDPTVPTGMVQNNQLWKNQSDFSPRVGLAWDVTGKGTTVIRAGGGVAYVTQQLRSFITSSVDDESSLPTGATLYNADGTTVQGPGNIQNLLTAQTPTTSGGVVNGNAITWATKTPLFTANNLQACGNGLLKTGSATVFNPPPCTGYGVTPNFQLPEMILWNLTVSHAFTDSLSLDVAYLGSHGSKYDNVYDINQPSLGATGATAELGRRPYETQFPWFSKIVQLGNTGSTNYAGFQASLSERLSHGLTFRANYTLAHALGQPLGQGVSGVMNNTNPKLDYGNLGTDARNHFDLTADYVIPGRKAPAQLLQGWAINSSVNFLTALPVNAADSTFDTSGTGEKTDRWTLYGSPNYIDQIFGGAGTIPCYGIAGSSLVKASNSPCTVVATGAAPNTWSNLPTACIAAANSEASYPGAAAGSTGTPLGQLAAIGCYFVNGTAIVPPSQGTYGTMTFNQLRGRGARLWNLSVTKDWKIKERLTTQFRAEVFNVLNRTQYASPGTNLGSPSTFGLSGSTPDVAKGNPVVGSGGPRAIQLALKILF